MMPCSHDAHVGMVFMLDLAGISVVPVGGGRKIIPRKEDSRGQYFLEARRMIWGREDAIVYIFHEMRVDSGLDFWRFGLVEAWNQPRSGW